MCLLPRATLHSDSEQLYSDPACSCLPDHTWQDGGEDGEGDGKGEEDIEQVGGALFEHGPVGYHVDHSLVLAFSHRLLVQVLMVPVESLQ